MNRSYIAIVILLAGFAAVGSSQPAAAEARLSIGGAYEPLGSFEVGRVTYLSLSDLAVRLGGSLDWEHVGHEVTYAGETWRFHFLVDAPYVRAGDSLVNIVYPVTIRDGQLFVPAKTFIPLFDRALPRSLAWDESANLVRVESGFFSVSDLSLQRKANGLLIEIFLAQAVSYDIFVTEGNWLNISLFDATVNANRIASRRDPRYAYKVNARQLGTTAQVSLRLKQPIESWSDKIVTDPLRLQVSIADLGFEFASDELATVGTDEKIDVIVIDPGHGGRDNGAVGHRGTREKDINLAISRELEHLLKKDRGFRVIMTRANDRTVSLRERADIANSSGADLFISIHSNASPKRHVQGWNVFFLAPAKNDSARAVEQLENSFFLREIAEQGESTEEEIDPVVGILNEMLMTEFQAESFDFAMMLDREMRRRLNTPARGVDQAGFFVLNKVFMPSVLVEAAFISNPAEEQLLKTRGYQRAVARSIFDAIVRFRDKYEQPESQPETAQSER